MYNLRPAPPLGGVARRATPSLWHPTSLQKKLGPKGPTVQPMTAQDGLLASQPHQLYNERLHNTMIRR